MYATYALFSSSPRIPRNPPRAAVARLRAACRERWSQDMALWRGAMDEVLTSDVAGPTGVRSGGSVRASIPCLHRVLRKLVACPALGGAEAELPRRRAEAPRGSGVAPCSSQSSDPSQAGVGASVGGLRGSGGVGVARGVGVAGYSDEQLLAMVANALLLHQNQLRARFTQPSLPPPHHEQPHQQFHHHHPPPQPQPEFMLPPSGQPRLSHNDRNDRRLPGFSKTSQEVSDLTAQGSWPLPAWHPGPPGLSPGRRNARRGRGVGAGAARLSPRGPGASGGRRSQDAARAAGAERGAGARQRGRREKRSAEGARSVEGAGAHGAAACSGADCAVVVEEEEVVTWGAADLREPSGSRVPQGWGGGKDEHAGGGEEQTRDAADDVVEMEADLIVERQQLSLLCPLSCQRCAAPTGRLHQVMRRRPAPACARTAARPRLAL